MKKVVFYCQHLLGIGHVSRSLSIVNELAKEFSVTYVQGGPEVVLRPAAGVSVVQLDPLLMKEADSSLYDPLGKREVADVFLSRAKVLADLAGEKFDAAVVELYPFGRKKFGAELSGFLGALRSTNPEVFVVSSVRDILVEKENSAERNAKIAALVDKQFNQVWVHSDESLIRFEETFSAANLIQEKLRYTGFVAEPSRATGGQRKKQILLSLGGGSVGEELYRAVAEVVPAFRDYNFLFVLGPYTNPELKNELARKLKGENAEFPSLLTNFEQVLQESALSISMAGYNTVMNLLNTRTPALVLAYDANHEQNKRAKLLEEKGFLRVLEDLSPTSLEASIRERFAAAYPATTPHLRGSERCRELLGEALGER